MVFLAGFGVWSATQTNHDAENSVAATRLSDAYESAHFAVGEEESLERKYRLEPSGAVRIRYDAAAADLVAALRSVERTGGSTDKALVARLLRVHTAYLGAIGRMFDAVDAGDIKLVETIDAQQTEPKFSVIEQRVAAATQAHRSIALSKLDALGNIERFVVIATPIAFAIGLLLLGFFSVQLARMYRRLRDQSEENEHNALHDALTELPNRLMFFDRVEQEIFASRGELSCFSVLMVDLNRFKEINDTLGHSTGDHLLREIGPRLRATLRTPDTIARLGGDEFAVLLPSADSQTAGDVARRVLAALHQPFVLAGLAVTVDASIGIATFPIHGDDAETLVQRADVAMYLAKEGQLGFSHYDSATDPYDAERLALVEQLRTAIASDELELYYQPKFNTADLRVDGVEALVRWNHPTRGMLAPDEFITLAEHTGLIKPLTMLVLRSAARQCRIWNDAGLDLNVAVNLSVANLLDLELVDDVAQILADEGLPAERLELEITESMVMSDPERAIVQLGRLDAMGIVLSIDDFGTGHSSLAYLRRLPVSELKIDRSFVRDVATDENAAAIVRSTIELAHSLGLRVVAEGVEDAAALEALQGLSCDQAQGFHLCRPAPPEQLAGELSHSAGTYAVPVV